MVVFAPHPDDETLGCGGTIAKKISQGYEVIIVIMTDGRHAFSKVFGIDSDPTPEELKEIRKEEVLRAVKILGVPKENVIFLGFEDGSLEENADKAVETIKEIMIKYSPSEIYFPFIKDFHPDHRAANRMIKKCAQELRLTCLKNQYSISHKYARLGPLFERILNLFRKSIVEVDVSDFLDLKKIAVGEFTSEISTISDEQKKPLIEKTQKFFKRKETFYLDK